MQHVLENVFAEREIIFTHRLTLDESNSCPSRPTVLDVRHLLQQTFKQKLRRRNHP